MVDQVDAALAAVSRMRVALRRVGLSRAQINTVFREYLDGSEQKLRSADQFTTGHAAQDGLSGGYPERKLGVGGDPKSGTQAGGRYTLTEIDHRQV